MSFPDDYVFLETFDDHKPYVLKAISKRLEQTLVTIIAALENSSNAYWAYLILCNNPLWQGPYGFALPLIGFILGLANKARFIHKSEKTFVKILPTFEDIKQKLNNGVFLPFLESNEKDILEFVEQLKQSINCQKLFDLLEDTNKYKKIIDLIKDYRNQDENFSNNTLEENSKNTIRNRKFKNRDDSEIHSYGATEHHSISKISPYEVFNTEISKVLQQPGSSSSQTEFTNNSNDLSNIISTLLQSKHEFILLNDFLNLEIKLNDRIYDLLNLLNSDEKYNNDKVHEYFEELKDSISDASTIVAFIQNFYDQANNGANIASFISMLILACIRHKNIQEAIENKLELKNIPMPAQYIVKFFKFGVDFLQGAGVVSVILSLVNSYIYPKSVSSVATWASQVPAGLLYALFSIVRANSSEDEESITSKLDSSIFDFIMKNVGIEYFRISLAKDALSFLVVNGCITIELANDLITTIGNKSTISNTATVLIIITSALIAGYSGYKYFMDNKNSSDYRVNSLVAQKYEKEKQSTCISVMCTFLTPPKTDVFKTNRYEKPEIPRGLVMR